MSSFGALIGLAASRRLHIQFSDSLSPAVALVPVFSEDVWGLVSPELVSVP